MTMPPVREMIIAPMIILCAHAARVSLADGDYAEALIGISAGCLWAWIGLRGKR